MDPLKMMSCVPCSGKEPKLMAIEVEALSSEVPEWSVIEEDGVTKLRRTFRFDDFASALDFTVAVGRAADAEDHHPTIITEWGKVTVLWWTHKTGGLHRNDFIMAAKVDALAG